ncbi:putative hydroxypyruvate isomerase isoform X2 [Dasypus novemcinctus]|uniref:putative hydroxypyruvate isomerase isoform X2 n=1 Tax=Dasypus novemcinctus TaxID=9361 RepID=UPI00062A9B88|nr:putative hydroxypyruvate isomerase isoform X2 [Dasypus novemcinctus]
MAPLRFSANLSWLFPELAGLPARLRAARSSGFEAAEVAWPYAEPPEALALAAREAGLRLVLINTPPGDQEKGEMGLGAVPGRQAAFREGLEQAVLYAKALGCPRRTSWDCWSPLTLASLTPSTSWIPPSRVGPPALCLLHSLWIPLLSLNFMVSSPPFLPAAAILEKAGRPNLQLQMDIFHWQIMDGNLTGNIRKFLPIVGHVQVAQVPGRGEPGSPGELNFPYLFQLLEDEGYKGFVGCEYRPRGDTVEGLSWLHSYWDKRGHPWPGQ